MYRVAFGSVDAIADAFTSTITDFQHVLDAGACRVIDSEAITSTDIVAFTSTITDFQHVLGAGYKTICIHSKLS